MQLRWSLNKLRERSVGVLEGLVVERTLHEGSFNERDPIVLPVVDSVVYVGLQLHDDLLVRSEKREDSSSLGVGVLE